MMVGADDGWIVGDSGTILRWNGAEWSPVTSPTSELLFSVSLVSPDDGWAVGANGAIIRWTGTAWIPEFPATALAPLLIGVTVVSVLLVKTSSKKRRKLSLQSTPRP